MTAKDHLKLLKAGFTIIRKDSVHVVSHTFKRKIKAKTPERHEWHTYKQGFGSAAELDREVAQLLTFDGIVED